MGEIRWPSSAQGRTIERFAGSPSDLVTEATEMRTTANAMKNAAHTLETLSNGDDGQQGKAVDGLRETAGDTHVLLGKAGEMYYGTASALLKYGKTMDDGLADAIDSAYTDAEEAWNTYDALPGDKDGRSYFLGINKPDEGSDEEKENDEEDQAKQQAYEDWETAAGAWDEQYDTWEDAWDTAVGEIEDAFDDDVKDGFGEWLGAVVDFLGWVALVVGVIALFVAGPFAAIAAAIAGVVLILTAIQVAMGDKGLGDLFWAAVGVIPFGKVGRLFRNAPLDEAGKPISKMDDFFSGNPFNPSTYTKTSWSTPSSFGDGVLTGLTGKNASGWKTLAKDYFRMDTTGMGRFRKVWEQGLHGIAMTPGLLFESGTSVVGHGIKVAGWGTQIAGTESPTSRYPWLKFF